MYTHFLNACAFCSTDRELKATVGIFTDCAVLARKNVCEGNACA